MAWNGKTQRKKPRRVSYLVGHGETTEQHRAAINSLVYVPAAGVPPPHTGEASSSSDLLFTASRDSAIRCFAIQENQPAQSSANELNRSHSRSSEVDTTVQAKFLYSMEGHVDWVNDLVALCNTPLLASCSNDGTVKLWEYAVGNPRSGRANVTLHHSAWAHTDYVKVIRYSGVRQILASGGLDQSVILWDLQTAGVKAFLHGADGRRQLKDPRMSLMPVASSVYSLAMDDEGDIIVTGSPDKIIRVFDARTGQRSLSLRGHRDNVRELLLLRPESCPYFLISAGTDHSIRTWDLRSSKCLNTFTVHHDSAWSLALYRGRTQGVSSLQSSWPPMRCGAEGLLTAGRDKRVYFVVPKPNLMFAGHPPAASAALVLEAPAPIQKIALGAEELGLWVATSSSTLLHYDLSCLATWVDEERERRSHYDEGSLLHCESVSRKCSHSASSSMLHAVTASTAVLENKGARLFFQRLMHSPPSHFTFAPSVFPTPPVGTTSQLHTIDSQSCMPRLGPSDPQEKAPPNPNAPDLPRMLSGPDFELPGVPPMTEFRLLNSKRHVLTQDCNKRVQLWDITTGQRIQDYGEVSLKAKEEEINPFTYIPPWCQIDLRLGSLMVHLDSPDCFNAEVHGSDVYQDCSRRDESTVNVGDAVLRALFGAVDEASSKKKRNPFSLMDVAVIIWGERPMCTIQPNLSLASTTKLHDSLDDEEDDDPCDVLPPNGSKSASVFLTPVTSMVPHFRKVVRRISSLDNAMVPQWVIHALQQGGQPNKDKDTKVSFALKSVDPDDLQDFMPKNHKLTAPRILRMYKVAEFIQEKLNLELPLVRKGDQSSRMAAEEYIHIYTQDMKELDKYTDLGTANHFFGGKTTNGTTLTLYFRRREVPPAPGAG